MSVLWPPPVFMIAAACGIVFLFVFAYRWYARPKGVPAAMLATNAIVRRKSRFTAAWRFAAMTSLLALLVVGYRAVLAERPEAVVGKTRCVSSGYFVVDLSGSTQDPDTYQKIGAALHTYAEQGGKNRRFGLVFFSNDGYELLYSCAKPKDFHPVTNFFLLERNKAYLGKNPWDADFIAGTEISKGLAVAFEAYMRNPHLPGAPVVLISDLENGETEEVMGAVLSKYERAHIPFRILQIGTIDPHSYYGYSYDPRRSRELYRHSLTDLKFSVSQSDFPTSSVASVSVRGEEPFPKAVVAIAITLLSVLFMYEAMPILAIARRRREKRRES